MRGPTRQTVDGAAGGTAGLRGAWRRVRRFAADRGHWRGRLLAAAVALMVCGAGAAVLASGAQPAGTRDAASIGRAPSPRVPTGIRGLAVGAPRGAVVLPVEPVHAIDPQPATSAVISGLAANGIPNVALNAYRVAAARIDAALPSCGIDWSLLAGIGRVESNHGRFGGATLAADGTSTPRIVGPALDGVRFAYVADTDRGRWDGDTRYDRAVGPMQFIPSTWRAYAVDADGRGADPMDINDAALAAASYLCRAGGDLRGPDGQRRAVLAYNHSDSYVAEVLALARAYATGVTVAGIPLVGDTTGPVPPPSGDASLPAAPGPAIGAGDATTSPDAVPVAPPGGTPPAAGGDTRPAGTEGASPGGSGSGGSGAGAGTAGSGSAGPGNGPAPATPTRAPAPAPAPGTPPAAPLPTTVPVPTTVPLPAPLPLPTSPVGVVSCVADLLHGTICPTP